MALIRTPEHRFDNPTKDLISANYTDNDVRALFSDFDIFDFKHYTDGFRGLFLTT